MSFLLVISIYLVGGVTFVPLLLVALFFFLRWYLPVHISQDQDDDLSDFSDHQLLEEYKNIKVTEIEERDNTGVNVHRSGWLTVTTEYYEFPQNSANEKNNEPENNKSAYTALYKLVRKKSIGHNEKMEKDEEPEPEKSSGSTSTSAQKRRKNKYFAVLRHGNLFLYKDEDQTDVLHVIVLSNHVIALWPRDLPDGQLFSKMSAICVLKKDFSKLSLSEKFSDSKLPPAPPPKNSAASLDYEAKNVTTLDILKNGDMPPKSGTFYIYADRNYDKEDWYFDLIRATKRHEPTITGSEKDLLEPSIYAKTFHPKTADVISLIQNLHSSEGQLHTRWFNAILGRIFLGLYGTHEFENYIKQKLLSKLQKINKPGFLEEFKIEKVNMGNSAPLLGSPTLNTLTPEGDLEVGASIIYNGGISFEVSTKVNINLGTRFKPRDISILLAVTFKSLKGNVVFVIKKPPTERIWWAFTTMPSIDISVEPVVSARQITTGMITRTIENKLKESIKESLVLPAMDDITFFSTAGEIFRGGVWDKSERPVNKTDIEDPTSAADANRFRSFSTTDSIKSSALTDDEVEEKFIESESIFDTKSSGSSIFTFKRDASKEKSSSLKEALNKGVMIAQKLNKSNSTVKISNDQYLADGSFVAGETDGLETDDLIDLGNETNDTKYVPNSFKKIGKWYFKEGDLPPESNINDTPEEKHVTKPVEMISSRRKKHKDEEHEENVMNVTNDPVTSPINSHIAVTGSLSSITQPKPTPTTIKTQPYTKAPEMTFPSTRSPSQFMNEPPPLPLRKSNNNFRRPPPKQTEDYEDDNNL